MKKLIPVLFVLCIPIFAFAQGALPTADDPALAGSFVWRMYKAGHLIPAVIVGLFLGLQIAQKRISWLRTGYRKLYIAAALAGLGMLAERVVHGATPNVGMILGALGAALTAWMNTQGEPKASEPAKA